MYRSKGSKKRTPGMGAQWEIESFWKWHTVGAVDSGWVGGRESHSQKQPKIRKEWGKKNSVSLSFSLFSWGCFPLFKSDRKRDEKGTSIM